MTSCQKIRLLNIVISGFAYGLLQVFIHSGYHELGFWEKAFSYGIFGLSLSLSAVYCQIIKHKKPRLEGIYFWASVTLLLCPLSTLIF